MLNHDSRLFGCREVGKSQASEYAMVKVVVEGVGKRQMKFGHELDKLLFLDSEWNVLDHDSGGDEILITFHVRRRI